MLNTLLPTKPQLTLIHNTKIITFDEALKLTGLCYSTFYYLFRANLLPHHKNGRKLTFDINDILLFMQNNKAGDWSKVSNEKSLLLACKCDVKALSKITKTHYNTVLYNIKKTDLPRFQYGRKIIVPQIYYIKNFSSDKTSQWSRYSDVK